MNIFWGAGHESFFSPSSVFKIHDTCDFYYINDNNATGPQSKETKIKKSLIAKEKEFGYLIYKGGKYLWVSPYIDFVYSEGKKEKYTLIKKKL